MQLRLSLTSFLALGITSVVLVDGDRETRGRPLTPPSARVRPAAEEPVAEPRALSPVACREAVVRTGPTSAAPRTRMEHPRPLPGTTRLSCWVRDPSGRFLADAGVTVQSDTGSWTGITNETGFVEFPNLEPARVFVQAEGLGFHRSDPVQVDLSASVTAGVVLRLRPGVEFTGVLVDHEGAPVQGVAVSVRTLDRLELDTTETDAEGRFSFPGLGRERLRLVVRRRVDSPGRLLLDRVTLELDLRQGEVSPRWIVLPPLAM